MRTLKPFTLVCALMLATSCGSDQTTTETSQRPVLTEPATTPPVDVSTSSTAAPSTAAPSTAAPSTAAPSPEPAAVTYYSEPISFTTEAGWTYELSADFSGFEISFGKNISSSPPGQARLTSSTYIPDNFETVVTGATPGRTPPEVRADYKILVPLPVYSGPDNGGSFGSCYMPSGWGFEREYFPEVSLASSTLWCGENAEYGTESVESGDLDEALVDRLLVEFETANEAGAAILVDFGWAHYGCGIVFLPDGRYFIGSTLAAGTCGP